MSAGLHSSWLERATRAWPNRCAVCHADSRGPLGRVCADCRVRHGAPVARCLRCALRVPDGAAVCGRCLRKPPPWDCAIAACDYAYPWDGLLGALKFQAALELAPVLAQSLAEAVAAANAPPVDVLLPVPLADARLRDRGYNQAALLARGLARRLGRRCDTAVLCKRIETPPQHSLPRDRRIANLRGAFVVEPRALARLRDRAVALVDDVLTSGATAGELTATLRAAGVATVQVWVVARTPDD